MIRRRGLQINALHREIAGLDTSRIRLTLQTELNIPRIRRIQDRRERTFPNTIFTVPSPWVLSEF
jgi:hypothetical protein